MNVAFRPHVDELAPKPAGEVVTIDVYRDLADARDAWRELEAAAALATPYQRYDWIALWHEHVSRHQQATPLIVVGRDRDHAALFLWPLMTTKKRGIRIATFFGESHSNLNSGLWRRDAAGPITEHALRERFAEVAQAHGIDLFALLAQPATIDGAANPFALLPHQSAPDDVYVYEIEGRNGADAIKHCLSTTMRGRLRTKERKLQKLAGYRYARATDAKQADRFLDAFLTQKAAHFKEQGIANIFAQPDIAAFLRAACHTGLSEGRPVIELHALEGGGEVIAIFGGASDGHAMSCMVNSYTTGEAGRWSPGLVLLTHLVADCADRGLARIDLGAGYARYKTFSCPDTAQVFDCFLPFSGVGRLAAYRMRALASLKRGLKSTPVLLEAARTIRSRLLG